MFLFKLRNIFKHGAMLKLGDLGIARIIETTKSLHEMAGTISYMSPELFKNESYSFNSDVW